MRVYDERVITEQGIYAKDAVPTDYAGSELEIQFNQIMIFADSGGSFREFRVMDYADVMDMDDNKGLGYKYELYGEEILVEATAPATLVSDWVVEYTTDGLQGSKMRAMHINSLIQRDVLSEDFEPPTEP